MALLGTLTQSTLLQLRSGAVDGQISEIEAQVAALASLLQQAATRLCPAASAAATDAALALLSGLTAARLQLPAAAAPGAAAGLERCAQHLLGVLQRGIQAPATPAAAAAAAPSGRDSQRAAELSKLVTGLGFSTHDWQAAQGSLTQRTAQALQQPGRYEASMLGPLLLPPPPHHAPAPLDSLMLAAEDTAAWQGGTGEPSLLHDAVRELLWVLRLFPPAPVGAAAAANHHHQQQQLSAAGWAAYWMLEPLALQQALADILQGAAHHGQQQQQQPQPPGGASSGGVDWRLQQRQQQQQTGQLLAQQPHWAATAAAAAAHPALHLVIRSTLHEWLAASGNPAVWRLLLLYMQAALGAYHNGAAQQQQQQQQQQQHGAQKLPLQLRVLYPAALAGLAGVLHMQSPSGASLQRVVGELEAYLCGGCSPPMAAAAAATVAGMQPAPAEHHHHQQQRQEQQPPASQLQQQVWQLLLDAPAWLLYCLQRLPLQRLLEMAGAGEGGGLDGSKQPGAAAADSGDAAQAAAANCAALLLWPGEPRRRQVVREALLLQLGDVDLLAMRPWLEMLLAWQHLLQSALAPQPL